MKQNQILQKIEDICARMSEAHNGDMHAVGVDNWFNKMQTIMTEAEQLSDSVGEGLKVGKLVSWGVGDGAAFYFVTRISAATCQLKHLEWVDNWHSPVVCDGRAMTGTVRQAVRCHDGLKAIFGKK